MTLKGLPRRFARLDLNALDVLPTNWTAELLEAVETHARPARLDASDGSSLEPPGTVIEYELLDGAQVAQTVPWLDRLYRNEFLQLASETWGGQLLASDDIRNGVNVNILRGRGSKYEWHVDTNPLTGLLFATSHDLEDGGMLTFRGEYDDAVCVPCAGHLLLFDAREAPHRVTPLKRRGIRVSVPMNFFTAETLAERSPALDGYLYSRTKVDS
ncbi:2OG-Fe(II) oxygenase [Plantactinospora veratri]|uniref:2OG-Fe(II) oxygenase n=1 Tax=Plantactinospora veratri TaxID=1436122 RepID=A0ABU7S6W1_9ACTN